MISLSNIIFLLHEYYSQIQFDSFPYVLIKKYEN
jgi:hypothetical protein